MCLYIFIAHISVKQGRQKEYESAKWLHAATLRALIVCNRHIIKAQLSIRV
jgi:hypothetical protein